MNDPTIDKKHMIAIIDCDSFIHQEDNLIYLKSYFLTIGIVPCALTKKADLRDSFFLKTFSIQNEQKIQMAIDYFDESIRKKVLLVSSNIALLYQFYQNGYQTCAINNGYNDIVSIPYTYEINHVQKIRTILK